MLNIFSAISTRLSWSKPFVAILGLICFGIFILSILGLGYFDSEIFMIPSLLLGLWSGLYFMLLSTFYSVPPAPVRDLNFFKKMKIRLIRGLYYFLGAVFIVLTLAVVVISFKFSGVWRAEY